MKELEFDEIPGVERKFFNREEAILYTSERQSMGRNLSSSEILKVAQMILAKNGGAAEIAKHLGISWAAVYQAVNIVLVRQLG